MEAREKERNNKNITHKVNRTYSQRANIERVKYTNAKIEFHLEILF